MAFQFDPKSLAPHFSEWEVDSLQRHMVIDYPGFRFDPDYLSHIRQYNGATPVAKYFQTARGHWTPIDRFLNFSDHHLVRDRDLSELNVNAMWSLIGDRLSIYQFPFATLPFGDFLCFDYALGSPPRIVLWYHEGSVEGCPRTEEVSGSFREFIDAFRVTGT